MVANATPASAPVGSYAASVIYSKVLLARKIQQRTFLRKLSGPVPLDAWMTSIEQSETARSYPIVEVMDLRKQAGDQVTVDIVDRVSGTPVMGDNIAKDKGSPLQFARDSVFINQARKVIDVGGRMSQQRTPHDLREVALVQALSYLNYLEDNLVQIHLSGARGSATGVEWPVPLASDPNFATICVNPVLPPTQSRYLGTTASVTDPSLVSTTNILTLNAIDDWRTINDTSPVPLQGIKLQGADGSMIEGEDSTLLLMYVSSEQWNQLQKDTSAQNWRTFLAQATERLAWTKHPLFKNQECGMWRGILVCQAPRPIQFNPGDNIQVMNADGVTQSTVQAQVRMHRGIILGAQALAAAYGNADRWAGSDKNSAGSGGGNTKMDAPYSWVEKLEDGNNLLQLFIGVMSGFKKLRYQFNAGNGSSTNPSPNPNNYYDNGVWAFDTYVPALR